MPRLGGRTGSGFRRSRGGPPGGAQGRRGHRVLRGIDRHRRPVVAVLLAAAVVTGLQTLRPTPPTTTTVAVAARELPAGHRLTEQDLRWRAWPVELLPVGIVSRPVGRVLSDALHRGDPISDLRVAGSGAPASLPDGLVAVTIRLGDPAAVVVVRPGQRADVLAAGAAEQAGSDSGVASTGESTGPRILVTGALVLAVPGQGPAVPPTETEGQDDGLLPATSVPWDLSDPGSAPLSGSASSTAETGVVVLAVSEPEALALAGAHAQVLSLAGHGD